MSKESKRRTINYKLVKISDHLPTLQDMLAKTLLDKSSQFHLAANRRESLTENDKSFRFINRFVSYEPEMLMCQIVQFEEGRSQMTIIINDEDEMFEVNPISAQTLNKSQSDTDKTTTEFLESMLYFGVMGNHMVMMGSLSLKSKELERHLNWYLKTLTNEVKDKSVILSDKPTANALKQLEMSPAKSVEIGSDIVYEQKLEKYEKDVTEAKSIRWTPSGLGASVLECLKDNGYIPNLEFNETLDDANLQVSIEFKYNYKTTKSGQRVLDTLSTSLRHMDKEDVKINLKGGGKIHGDDLKLSHQISVIFFEGKVDESSLYYQMRDWLYQKISTKEVTPDLADIVESK
ncbi:hypothetical protein ACGMNB_18450 [Shewanella oncorhynchi]|uniref:hypothetical protein n=1 Tax=Shewanella oncorhynchi TaxID=2726434 RepID=UPI0037471914